MADDVSDVIEKIAERTNAHDLEGMVAFIHPDYVSEHSVEASSGRRPRLEPEGD